MKGNNLLAKNKVMCTCGKCPTYHECTKENIETMFCSVGKISCTLTKKACLCPTRPVTPIIGLSQGYYCMSGSEKEQRGI